jgi:hypothetical protein
MKKIKLVTSALTIASIAGFSVFADDKPAAQVNGVKGVKQEAVKGIRKEKPPEGVKSIEQPATTPPPIAPKGEIEKGIDSVDGVNQITEVKAPNAPAPTNPVPEESNAAEGANQVEGIKAVAPDAVMPVAPPQAGAVSTIQAVKGVQGIVAPKQQNLEAALLMKETGDGPPATKAAAAAAALLKGPPGLLPGPAPGGDGRDDFQEFEDLTTPGS